MVRAAPAISCKTQVFLFDAPSPVLPHVLSLSLCSMGLSLRGPLQTAEAVLLVNVPVPLLLLPVLKDHGDAQHKKGVYADDAEGCSEDQVQISVGK